MLENDLAELQDKIYKVGEENRLEIDVELSKFPITARIRPNLEERDQLRMFKDEGSDFVNGEIKLIFDDELTMTVLNDFKIEDSLLNKIKGLVKKLHYTYLQLYFKRNLVFDSMLKGGKIND